MVRPQGRILGADGAWGDAEGRRPTGQMQPLCRVAWAPRDGGFAPSAASKSLLAVPRWSRHPLSLPLILDHEGQAAML